LIFKVGWLRRPGTPAGHLQLSSVFMAPFNFEPAQPGRAYQEMVERTRRDHDEPLLELLGYGGVNTRY